MENKLRPVRCEGIKHRIKKGDTLYKLSKCYNVSLTSILRANKGVDVYNLEPGSIICIPDNGTWQDILTRSCIYNGMYEENALVNENETNTTEYEKEKKGVEVMDVENDKNAKEEYKVAEGDTLEDILDRFGLTVNELIRLNYEKGICLCPGKVIIVRN